MRLDLSTWAMEHGMQVTGPHYPLEGQMEVLFSHTVNLTGEVEGWWCVLQRQD
jgi:hypothetical protein